MRRISLIIFGAIALLMVGYYINNILQAAGVYRELAYEYDGTCLTIEGVIGAEDIQIDHQTGLAYISNQDRRKYQAGTPEPGFIAVLNMAEPRPEPVRLDHGDVPDFYPHGISLYRMDDGGLRLFVISHPPEQPHRVEIFDVADGTRSPISGRLRTIYSSAPTISSPSGLRPFIIPMIMARAPSWAGCWKMCCVCRAPIWAISMAKARASWPSICATPTG